MDPNQKGIGRESSERNPVPQGINYLLAIGIDTYMHCPRLYNAVKDAQAFVGLLTEKYQFEKAHVKTLLNREATQLNIFEAFKALVNKITPKDNLVVYFSGHGEYEEEIDEGYWIPAEAEIGHQGQYVSNSRIMKYLSSINSHHTFVVADSCFSGSLFAQKKINPKIRLEVDPSRWLLTSGRKEVVSDGKPGDHSPFADNLLYYLKNNNDGSLSVTDLINFVVSVTLENAQQTPRGEPLPIQAHKGGQFFFHQKTGEAWEAPSYQPRPKFSLRKFLNTSFEGKSEEEAAWDFARKQGTIQAFLKYRKTFPKGKYTQEALRHIGRQEEAEAWEKARQQNTMTAYLLYLHKYPEGRFVKEAHEGVNIFQSLFLEDDFWKKASSRGRKEDYQEYLDRFPNGKYRTQAWEKIAASIKKEVKVPAPPRRVEIVEKPYRKKKTGLLGRLFRFIFRLFLLLALIYILFSLLEM